MGLNEHGKMELDEKYCKGCPHLHFDKKKSLPSPWLGEGLYIFHCMKFNVALQSYLSDALRLEECKDPRWIEIRKSQNEKTK